MFFRRTLLATLLVALVLLLTSSARTAPQSAGKFVWLSDIHFNPTANAQLVDSLARADVGDWSKILKSSPGTPSKYGEDTDWPLLSSSFAAIRRIAHHAQFTVVTGDVFVHDFRNKFNATATNHDDDAFRQFALKTFQFIAAQLGTIAPGKPVLFTLGNNDGDCGDYALQPYGPFLRNTSSTVEKMLAAVGNKRSEVDWSDAGNYDVSNPALEHARIISVNSVFFSAKFQNTCGSGGNDDPGNDQIAWLESRLADAKVHQEKVWLIFHIAPGIDGWATSHAGSVVTMWKPEFADQFNKLVEQYHDTVAISLGGHEHTDDFRLVDHSLILLAPGISPVIGQNPAFRVVTYGDDAKLSDAATYYLSNLAEFDGGQKADWKPEYSFQEKYGISGLNYETFEKFFNEVGSDREMRNRWMMFYGVSHPQGKSITVQTFPWLYCAAGNSSEPTYQACIQQMQGSTH